MDINATLLGQLITFLVLVWFTMRYVWPPITKAIEDREKTIAGGLEAAERSKRELEQAEHKALDLIRLAKTEATQVIDQAQRRAVLLIEEAKSAARVEGDRIILQANDEIAREVSQAKEELRKQLAGLAVLGAEKIIRRNLDASAQKDLLAEFVAEI